MRELLTLFGRLFFGGARSKSSRLPPAEWITDGSRVDQAPEGPTVTWTVNGSTVSYDEV